MKFLGKNKQTETPGRRRPGQDVPRSPAFSYYAQRSNDAGNTGRREANEHVDERKHAVGIGMFGPHKLSISVIIVVCAVAATYLLALVTQPRVVLLEDAATAYFLQDKSVYSQTAEKTLSKSLFNRNKLTIDTDSVRTDLMNNFPEIKNVSVALPIVGNQPKVYIEPYKPSFILTTVNRNAFLLDATGRALATTSQITDVDKLGIPTMRDATGTEVVVGNRVLPTTTVSFAQTVVAALKAKDVGISTLVLQSAFELNVYVAGTPYYIKFNMQDDPLQQAGAFLAIKKRLSDTNVNPAQYIDVRVPERAYYR